MLTDAKNKALEQIEKLMMTVKLLMEVRTAGMHAHCTACCGPVYAGCRVPPRLGRPGVPVVVLSLLWTPQEKNALKASAQAQSSELDDARRRLMHVTADLDAERRNNSALQASLNQRMADQSHARAREEAEVCLS